MTKKQDQIEDSIADFNLLFDSTPDVMGIVDHDGYYRSINPAWTETLGHSIEDITGTPFLGLFHPDDRASVGRSPETVTCGPISEVRVLRKDGSYRWLEWWAIRPSDHSEIITVGRDIEDRKALETRIAKSEENFKDLIEGADDAICTADLEGRLTSVNRATERMSGRSRDEILGKPFADFVASEYHETLKQMTQMKLDGRESTVCEVEIVDTHGTRIPVELNTRLRFKDGRPIGIHGIARDIRVRRKLAEDLRQRNSELEAANRTIRSLLNQDALTKLANRRSLQEELDRAMSFSRRSGQPLAVVICDVDRFKQVNDNFGHAAGDEVLSAFGGLLGISCRKEDTAARYGGEEFVLLLPNTSLQAAMEFAERVRSRTENLRVPSGAAITVSCGVTVIEPKDSAEGLIARADSALYAAKQKGRNRVASG